MANGGVAPRVAPLALALLVAAAACGSSSMEHARATTTSSTPSTTIGASTSFTTPCNFAGTTGPQRNAQPSSTQLLTDVTAAGSGCVDTLAFTFRPGATPAVPGYELSYQRGPFADSGSGRAVTVDGTAYLVVRFVPAAIADLSQANAPPTYTGPRAITPTTTTHVRQLKLFDAFEGVVAWVIGLDARDPVQVSTGPGSLTITVGPA